MLFVLFCFVCHVEISRTVHPPVACLVLSESSRRGRVHMLCFVGLGITVEKLWIFKVFMSYKNYKIIFIYILSVETARTLQ